MPSIEAVRVQDNAISASPSAILVRETGQSFNARISKMNSRVDGVSQQLEVEARIEKGEGRLLPGMVGSAQFPQGRTTTGK